MPLGPASNAVSARHLLSCPCGTQIPVAVSQAGGPVTCPDCGVTQSVPRLRDLRELPVEATDKPQASGWGFRQGVLTAGLLLAAALAAGAGWWAANEPGAPPEFNAATRNEDVAADLDRLSPADMWALYTFRYAPMAMNGMRVEANPRDQAANREIAQIRFYRDLCLYAAGGVLAVTLGAFAMLPR